MDQRMTGTQSSRYRLEQTKTGNQNGLSPKLWKLARPCASPNQPSISNSSTPLAAALKSLTPRKAADPDACRSRGSPSRCTASPTSATSGRSWIEVRSEEHTSELQSLRHLVCRLLLEK